MESTPKCLEGVIRTPEEIMAHFEQLSTGADDFMGFQRNDLLEFLPYRLAKPFLKSDCSEQEWQEAQATVSSPLDQIVEYLPFAWQKANDCRGISAHRSIHHMLAWTWLIDDALYTRLKQAYGPSYQHYGKELLEMVSDHVGFDWKAVDNGKRVNGEDE